jgi:hypothetical protein
MLGRSTTEKKSWSLLSGVTVRASERRAVGSIAIVQHMRKHFNISVTCMVSNF